jgi:hypothetical protein
MAKRGPKPKKTEHYVDPEQFKLNLIEYYKTGKGEIQKDKRGRVIETEKAADNFDAKILRGRIFGLHVTNYMNKLKKEDPAKYKRQFS